MRVAVRQPWIKSIATTVIAAPGGQKAAHPGQIKDGRPAGPVARFSYVFGRWSGARWAIRPPAAGVGSAAAFGDLEGVGADNRRIVVVEHRHQTFEELATVQNAGEQRSAGDR